MKLYAETSPRRALQVMLDVAVLVWVGAWVSLGLGVRSIVLALAEPGRRLERAGDDVAGAADRAVEAAAAIPLVGEVLAQPFESIAGAARQMAAAGVAQQQATAAAATTLAVMLAAAPILAAVLVWAWWRLRWVHEASAAARLRTAPEASQLFALRALASMPLGQLAAFRHDPYAAFEAGDVEELAALQLAALGLRAPRRIPRASAGR